MVSVTGFDLLVTPVHEDVCLVAGDNGTGDKIDDFLAVMDVDVKLCECHVAPCESAYSTWYGATTNCVIRPIHRV